MTMGDDHLKILKCLVDTGAEVLRSTLERKVLNNNAITFEQYLDNVKHQFYHQFEKGRNKPCFSQSPDVNCNVNGNMDKKIFEKVYNKTSELDTHHCLGRFEVKVGVSSEEFDLNLWKKRLNWDDALNKEDDIRWKEILSQLLKITDCEIPRSIEMDSLPQLRKYK
ncbi:unnamed protein product [Mytilus edulis]|uniref:Uncharacterized protein n=1 Tax=Mytilus edulis TaxID=6550 RepID=A0A8S3TXM2_MYTED|nr:unnamed protein product [Mytilus edulis]